MDVTHINAFIQSVLTVLPQFGVNNIKKNKVSIKSRNIETTGVMINVGVVGDVKGNVVYSMNHEAAKNTASIMMMGMPVMELDDMSKSALTELANMVTANAATNLSNIGVSSNISTPTLIEGRDIRIDLNCNNVLCIEFSLDKNLMELNLALGT